MGSDAKPDGPGADDAAEIAAAVREVRGMAQVVMEAIGRRS